MKVSVCGLACDECSYYGQTCPGCTELKGKPFWAENGCDLYICCKGRGYKSCGNCSQLPCQLFLAMKDPDVSTIEHQQELVRRIKRLKDLQK